MTKEPGQPDLSHLTLGGEVRMVDVSNKPVTTREATASAVVKLRPDVVDRMMGGTLSKGDALATARVAGILAAKRTGELIPLCHPLPLEWASVEFDRTAPGELTILFRAKTEARTGVEMEALTGAAVTALTLYDMAKAADKAIVIGPIQLERKSGGRSGTYERSSASNAPSD